MATIHISEAEAARDLPGLLARVRAGANVIIDDPSGPIQLRVAGSSEPGLLSDSFHLAKDHTERVTLDDEFGRDLEAIINSHPEPLKNPWD